MEKEKKRVRYRIIQRVVLFAVLCSLAWYLGCATPKPCTVSPVDIEEIKALPLGSAIDIKTSFKPIQITLPAGIEVQGTARTEFGKIVTDIPVTLEDSGSAGGRSVTFRTGEGGLTLKLETTADITIRKK